MPFGDSFTIGYGVDNNQTFVALDNHKSSSINFGVPGFGPIHMFERANKLLQTKQLQYKEIPTLWFHFFMGNDIGETLSYIQSRHEEHVKPHLCVPAADAEVKPLPSTDYKKRSFVFDTLNKFPNSTVDISNLYRSILARSAIHKSLVHFGIRWQAFKLLSEGIYWVPAQSDAISSNCWKEHKSDFLQGVSASLTKISNQSGGQIIISLIPPKEICLGTSAWETIVNDIRSQFEAHGVLIIDYMDYNSCPELLSNFYKLDTHFSKNGHKAYFEDIIRNNRGADQP